MLACDFFIHLRGSDSLAKGDKSRQKVLVDAIKENVGEGKTLYKSGPMPINANKAGDVNQHCYSRLYPMLSKDKQAEYL